MQKEGCDLAPVLSLQQKRRLIGMPTYFAATYLGAVFFGLQRFKVCPPLRINLSEIIIIDFDYFKLVCRAMWWIEAIHMEPQEANNLCFHCPVAT